jgi:NTP pyrophosphatase (non-canonical NTP hydrolase)
MSSNLIDEYAKFVKSSYRYDFGHFDILYLSNGLGGEAGEVQNDVKKLIRKLHDGGDIRDEKYVDKIKDELGDVLWYVFALSNKLKIPVKDIINHNMNKNKSK